MAQIIPLQKVSPVTVLPLKVIAVFFLLDGVLGHLVRRGHLIPGLVAEFAIALQDGARQFLQLPVNLRVHVFGKLDFRVGEDWRLRLS